MNKLAVVFVIVCGLTSASNADIVNDEGVQPGFGYIDEYPFAQTFTATANEASVRAVSFMWSRTQIAQQIQTIEADVREGVALNGTVLGSKIVSVNSGDRSFRDIWIDFNFDTPVQLSAGNIYTLTFENRNAVGGIIGSFVVSQNNYSGGTELGPEFPFPDPRDPGKVVPNYDLAFRVLAVPEPSTTSLAVGLTLSFIGCRRPTSHNRV